MQLETDYIVVGSGIAGLWFAYTVSKTSKVMVLTKKGDSDSNTNYAQGGIAAAVGSDDSPRLHLEDTLNAGNGLCDIEASRIMVEEGPGLVRALKKLHIDFSTKAGAFELGIEGGHSKRRVVHAADTTGQAVENGLLGTVRSSRNATIMEQFFVIDLLIDDSGQCYGVIAFNREDNMFVEIHAKAIMLASGGLCWLYEHTTNPRIATGDGVAMAWRAGCEARDLEFVQFHPTSLFGATIDGRAFLISEAVRGEGGILKTPDGERFMTRYHTDAEMAPRDVVARAIYNELRTRRLDYVLLDLSSIPSERILERFPMIAETCRRFGLDITKEPIPVVPAAHYSVGGIKTDLWGRTSVKGIYASGECANTGVHGANRLASNSLLEALVFANRAAMATLEDNGRNPLKISKTPFQCCLKSIEDPSLINSLASSLRQTMWRFAGIVRSVSEMERGRARIAELVKELDALYPQGTFSPAIQELRNMLLVGDLILQSALKRKESRGLHYVEEYPSVLPEAGHTILKPD